MFKGKAAIQPGRASALGAFLPQTHYRGDALAERENWASQVCARTDQSLCQAVPHDATISIFWIPDKPGAEASRISVGSGPR